MHQHIKLRGMHEVYIPFRKIRCSEIAYICYIGISSMIININHIDYMKANNVEPLAAEAIKN